MQLHSLPNWYCSLIKSNFDNLNEQITHRLNVATVYAKSLDKKILSTQLISKTTSSTNLRFPIFVKNRDKLINFLKKSNIFISDIWYDAPIAPKKYLGSTDYQGNCKKAETISKEIINLPTHKNVSIKQAEIISQKINQWLKSQ